MAELACGRGYQEAIWRVQHILDAGVLLDWPTPTLRN